MFRQILGQEVDTVWLYSYNRTAGTVSIYILRSVISVDDDEGQEQRSSFVRANACQRQPLPSFPIFPG